MCYIMHIMDIWMLTPPCLAIGVEHQKVKLRAYSNDFDAHRFCVQITNEEGD